MEERKSDTVNWNFKNWFITYAQADFTREGLVAFLLKRFEPYEVVKWVVSVEPHRDGGYHYHAVFCLLTKCHTRNPRFLDFGDKHPNIKACGSRADDVQRVYYYTIKQGDYIEKWDWCDGPLDYRRRKGDVEEYIFDMQMGKRGGVFPFRWPDEVVITGMPEDKRRHYWWYGPPDWGKTRWVNDTFAGKSVFMRPSDDLYPYEGYRGEAVVIFDDVLPKGKEELTSLTNTWRVTMHVFGKTRYRRVYWPIDESRLVIILANDRPQWEGELWFESRFHIKRLR